MDRLCALSSSQLSYKLSGKLPYPIIEFYYLNHPYFNFEFLSYHYKSKLLVPVSIDWKKPYFNLKTENPWLGAFFNRTNEQPKGEASLSYIFNPSLFEDDQIYSAFDYILRKNLQYFNPILIQWIKKKNLLGTDSHLKKMIKVVGKHLDKSFFPYLAEQFPFVKGEVIKSLIKIGDLFPVIEIPFVFSKDGLTHLEEGQEKKFFPLKFAYNDEKFNSLYLLLGMWSEGKIQIEYGEFKEILIDFMCKGRNFPSFLDKARKPNKKRRQALSDLYKIQTWFPKIIEHPIITKLTDEEKVNLAVGVAQAPCSKVLSEKLFKSLCSGFTIEQKTALLHTIWKQFRSSLSLLLIENGADPFLLLPGAVNVCILERLI